MEGWGGFPEEDTIAAKHLLKLDPVMGQAADIPVLCLPIIA